MIRYLAGLFDRGFMPHGHCFFWKPELVWTHTIADSVIAIAYYSIPLGLVYFVRRRKDIVFHWMFLMFGAFIFACGTTHVLAIWTLWDPIYRVDGLIKVVTALLSIGTAIALWRMMPRALALPSPADLEAANAELRRQVMERKIAEQKARRLNAELERRVELRTGELKRSNEELQQFAYVASHDLQEPIRMVASYSELLGQRYRGRLDADADEFIEQTVEGAKRMHALVNDLLQYSRVEHDRERLEEMDAASLLREIQSDLRVVFQETGAQITHGELPEIHGDASQLRQLFQNLIGNAIKFRGAEPPRIHVEAVLRDDEWWFSVRDNGMGIHRDHHDRVFVIFQRLHTREQYPGTGIGLAICKKIVERHGGHIWLESEPGRGSTFWFTLPANVAVTP